MDIGTILPCVSRFGIFFSPFFGSFFHPCITVASLPMLISVFSTRNLISLHSRCWPVFCFPIGLSQFLFSDTYFYHLSDFLSCFFWFFSIYFLLGVSLPFHFPYTCPKFLYCWYLSFVFWSLISFLVEFSLVFLEDAVVFS